MAVSGSIGVSILGRVAGAIPVMFVVAIVVFMLLQLAPGDPAAMIAGDSATPEQVAQIHAQLGLDRPLPVQFVSWLGHVASGDLGTSILSHEQVGTLILQRIGPTVYLALLTICLSIVIALPLGTLAARFVNTWVDKMVGVLSVLSFSLPIFLVAYGLIRGFSLGLRWLPVQGYSPPADGLGPFLSHLVLPAVSLSLVHVALITRMVRASLLDVLSTDYIRAVRAKGATETQVLAQHALPNAAIPIVTTIGGSLALLFGGVVVTENVFALPGIGRLVVESIVQRDLPIVQGVLLVFSAVYVAINLSVDLSYVFLDPRIRK